MIHFQDMTWSEYFLHVRWVFIFVLFSNDYLLALSYLIDDQILYEEHS